MHRDHALALLDSLTPACIEKEQARSNKLLAFLGSAPADKNPSDWPKGWCEGWAFAVPPAMASSLDIKLLRRSKSIPILDEHGHRVPLTDAEGEQVYTTDGKPKFQVRTRIWNKWTQGSFFDFHTGYTFYDAPETYTLPWAKALHHINTSLQIIEAIPAVPAVHPMEERKATKNLPFRPARPAAPRSPGIVVFQVYKANAQKTALLPCGMPRTVSQDSFVRILIAGVSEAHSEGKNMASVHLTDTLECYDAVLSPIEFCGTYFCLTGEFALGSRDAVEKTITQRGGTCLKHPLASGCILVVGTVASDGWAYGDYGTKIENAMRYRKNGNPVRIINEDYFVAELLRNDELNLPLSVKPIAPKKPNLDILAGLASGMIADGIIVQEEADFLLQWLKNNASLHSVFPVSVLLPRIEKMLCDSVLDKNEAKELFDILKVVAENIK